MKLSVLICTRNRAGALEGALGSILAQRMSGDHRYEVIVVDNGSSDGTGEVVRRMAARYDRPIQYAREPRQGLSRARNRALSIAAGDVFVFTDDDVRVAADWLDQIAAEFSADPDLQMLGGRVLPAREGLQRVAVQESDERQRFSHPHGGTFVMGANMAFRRGVFERIGGFDQRLGAGRFFAGAEEADIFYRGLKAGYSILYAPNVLVYHDHDRITVEQACRLEYGYGKGCSAYLVKHAMGGDRYAMKMVYWLIHRLPSRWFARNAPSQDILDRRRAQVRGILIGLLVSPALLFERPE